jgi:hypothetical protein
VIEGRAKTGFFSFVGLLQSSDKYLSPRTDVAGATAARDLAGVVGQPASDGLACVAAVGASVRPQFTERLTM